MTRYSASRGLMYTAPPVEETDDEAAELPAEAAEQCDPTPADD